MSSTGPDDERLWEQGWEGHSLAQLRRLARLTLAEKLEWLEEAHRLVLHLESQRASREASSGEGGGERRNPVDL